MSADVTKDLLEALKIVTSQLERVGDTRRHKDGEFIDLGREAIARAEAAMAEPQPDADGAWKASVIDQLIIAHILTAEHANDPLKAVQDLLAFESEIAIDPRVSKEAARLVEQARAEEREACAKVCESQRDAFNENLQVWQENPTLTPCDEFISDWDSEAKIGEQYAAAIRARGQK